MAVSVTKLGWVVLTMGDRWPATSQAIDSLLRSSPGDPIVLVLNGADPAAVPTFDPLVRVLSLPENVGVPGGRDAGVREFGGEITYVGFLDDDAAIVTDNVGARIRERFDRSPEIAAISMGLVDPDGDTARRHIPRVGRGGRFEAGTVTTFLGGACALRRTSYARVGGYWADLFYSHEELELAWRLVDDGATIFYDPALVVEHPKTEISRHDDGWRRTGRNRVLVARRNLPFVVLLVHTLFWLVVGFQRAPGKKCKRSYVSGWKSGWSADVARSPMNWATVIRLSRAGRPPII